jgi:cyclopropane-fatty-acyl-phospholipid synthase
MTLIGSSVSSKRAHGRRSLRAATLRRMVDRALPTLHSGRLRLIFPHGETIERRGDNPGPDVSITVNRWRGLWRLVLEGEHGFADGYLDGDWSTTDLPQLLDLFMLNESQFADPAESSLLGLARNRLLHTLRNNTRRGSRRNIAAHYDLGNDFFRPWLDAGMNYSSALYTGEVTLEEAQLQKLDRIADLLALGGGERVLEIGCGWGALAERLIRRFGATVTGITLSTEQLEYARARLGDDVSEGRADFRLVDYRDTDGRFDRIVSIEMIEAVGEHYWPAYFAKLRASLVNGGSALIQAITIDESRFTQYRRRPDFIQRHIFPGGMLPTVSIIAREATQAGLRLVHHESFGGSYARTLHEWRDRFLQAAPSLETLGFNQRFRRMWEYYLAYCETGFRFGAIDVGFYKLAG